MVPQMMDSFQKRAHYIVHSAGAKLQRRLSPLDLDGRLQKGWKFIMNTVWFKDGKELVC